MAPTMNPGRTLQQNRTRPGVARPVLPALPLSYVQKRKKESVAPVKQLDQEEKQTAVEIEPIAAIAPSEEEETKSKVTAVVNGTREDTPETIEETEDEVAIDEKAKVDTEEKLPEMTKEAGATIVEEQTDPAESLNGKKNDAVPLIRAGKTDTLIADAHEPPSSTPSVAPSASSRATYQMPPPFVPANQALARSPPTTTSRPLAHPDMPDPSTYPPFPPPLNGYHHAHPSQSSVAFGGYPDSNNSSPAPSSGHFPPPPFVQHNGHHQQHTLSHAPQPSNGNIPYVNGLNQFAHPPPGYYPRSDHATNGFNDVSRRQMASYGAEGYSPSHTPYSGEAHAFDPSTPHSFQGSQNSGPSGETEGGTNATQYSNGATNGINGYNDQYKPPRAKQPLSYIPNNFPVYPDGHAPMPADHSNDLLSYIHDQFHNPQTADCILELRFSDDRCAPVFFPAHQVILARSTPLVKAMAEQTKSSSDRRAVTIVSDSAVLRPEAFTCAIQRLYGWRLLDHAWLNAYAPQMPGQTLLPFSRGSTEDRFTWGLAYAVAGFILQHTPVIARGLEIAAAHINWNTIEQAINFTFERKQSDKDYQALGPLANLLYDAAINFLITAFPANFNLVASVADSKLRPRLPAVQDSRPRHHSHQLSQIKFGELGSDDNQDVVLSTISRILLNLPHETLKFVLESSRLGDAQGWVTSSLRQEVMSSVVQEREKRRIRVLTSQIPNSERGERDPQWKAVGFHEFVQPSGSNEMTVKISGAWVGFHSS